MDHILPGSSVHGILQARILEWVAHAILQGIFPTQGSNLNILCLTALACGFFSTSATGGSPICLSIYLSVHLSTDLSIIFPMCMIFAKRDYSLGHEKRLSRLNWIKMIRRVFPDHNKMEINNKISRKVSNIWRLDIIYESKKS